MDIKELLDKNIAYHDELCPAIWEGTTIKPDVKEKLLDIAKFFYDYIGTDDVDVIDVIVTGSIANYNWSKYSDVDLHLVVDMTAFGDDEELFNEFLSTKKALWNKEHDITIHGHDVEVYVQDINEPHHSTGVYSLFKDEWERTPVHNSPQYNKALVHKKVHNLSRVIRDFTDECEDVEVIERFKKKLKNMRQCGLDREGEFSVENLVFKILRNNGLIEELFTKYGNAIDKCYSIGESK